MKKIKTKIILSLFVLAASIIVSCTDEYLDVPIADEISTTYFDNEGKIQRGIGGMYAELANIYSANLGTSEIGRGVTIHPYWLLQGDDLTNSGNSNAEYEAFSGMSPSDNRNAMMWQRYYIIINRSNFMLEQIEASSAVYVDTNLKNYNRGEALFFRAWAHMQIWEKWRRGPLKSEWIKSLETATNPPSTGFEMLNLSISDLEEAKTLLPDSWDVNNKGRVFKNSALGLLVKAYTLRANYADEYSGGDRNGDYGKAIAAFEAIDDSESTIVGVHFGENFDYRTENNPESLFEFQAGINNSENPWLDNDYGGGNGALGAYYGYFTDHWANGSSGGGSVGPTDKLMNAFDAADPRRAETIGTYGWSRFGGNQFIKYINGDRGDLMDNKNGQGCCGISSGVNTRILRLADVKLTVAEAYLQTGNPSAALTQVNDIRRRARLSTSDGSEATVPADLGSVTMQDIMDERFLELAGEEGIRWVDLRRWHAAGLEDLNSWTASDFSFPNSSDQFQFKIGTHLLFPIPAEELEANPLMRQAGNNPGY
ncbi:RagB/SusD family nutrient uptake outer membrane protein [Reichenbachiella sp. MALMAid0571]|uniref:RagB/SusD family nutrient uptake outer membrane protein n=1 Tax=Reichenbachiella sp. MALMAid0571 TaxID=3143939 RepID=UPI0032E006FC